MLKLKTFQYCNIGYFLTSNLLQFSYDEILAKRNNGLMVFS